MILFFVKINRFLFLAFFTTMALMGRTQTYYGLDSIGRLEIKDDSVARAYFINHWRPVTGSFEEIKYKKNGDTIFLKTTNLQRAKIDTSFCSGLSRIEGITQDVPVIVKVFLKNKSLKFGTSNYFFSYEEIDYLDTTTNRIITRVDFQEEAIIVIKIAHTYLRVFVPKRIAREESDGNHYISIDVSGSFTNHGLYLDDFPLLMDGDKLYPVDTLKNFQCWIDNGFHFPVMQKKVENCYFKYPTAEWNIGLQGLPGFF